MKQHPSEEQKLENAQLVMRLVENFPEPRRGLVKKMLEGPIGQEYFVAPASSREEFHGCYPGGLCQHSLNVVSSLYRMSKALCPDRWDKSTLAFVGLFHDLGKVGDGERPGYVPNPSDWHRNKGMLYEVNARCVYMPSSERGLFLLQRYGIVLEAEEYLAIRLNDGQYEKANDGYKMREPDLALLLHWADRWSVSVEKDSEVD